MLRFQEDALLRRGADGAASRNCLAREEEETESRNAAVRVFAHELPKISLPLGPVVVVSAGGEATRGLVERICGGASKIMPQGWYFTDAAQANSIHGVALKPIAVSGNTSVTRMSTDRDRAFARWIVQPNRVVVVVATCERRTPGSDPDDDNNSYTCRSLGSPSPLNDKTKRLEANRVVGGVAGALLERAAVLGPNAGCTVACFLFPRDTTLTMETMQAMRQTVATNAWLSQTLAGPEFGLASAVSDTRWMSDALRRDDRFRKLTEPEGFYA